MAVKINNIDEVINAFAEMDKAATGAALRQVRKRFRATIRRFIPVFKNLTPKKTGASVKSIKIKSRSKRGVSTVKLSYGVPYAAYANYNPANKKSLRFATEGYRKSKADLEKQAIEDIKGTFTLILQGNGFNVV